MSSESHTPAPPREPSAEELGAMDEEMTALVARLTREPEQRLPYSTDPGSASDLRRLIRGHGYRVVVSNQNRGEGEEWRVSARRFDKTSGEDEVLAGWGRTIPLATVALMRMVDFDGSGE